MKIQIEADNDYITCVNCRVCVPRGMKCSCKMQTLGPATENIVRKTLTRRKNGSS